MDKPDWTLLQDFTDGDDSAFIRIYETYKKPLYVFCCRMIRDGEEAKDVVQDVFTTLYRRPPAPVGEGSLKSWLYTVARNGCLKSLRRSHNSEEEEPEPIGSDDVPYEAMERSERTRIVLHALEELAPEYREVILLREWNGMNYREISDVLHCSIPAVKARLFKARKGVGNVLRKHYAEECHEL